MAKQKSLITLALRLSRVIFTKHFSYMSLDNKDCVLLPVLRQLELRAPIRDLRAVRDRRRIQCRTTVLLPDSHAYIRRRFRPTYGVSLAIPSKRIPTFDIQRNEPTNSVANLLALRDLPEVVVHKK